MTKTIYLVKQFLDNSDVGYYTLAAESRGVAISHIVSGYDVNMVETNKWATASGYPVFVIEPILFYYEEK